MRHLNKIIFLNSANIPYAEVMLDGNVHFAGTQGVGKSTVLRALLFFYNADKMRLGIQSGQKTFEEFYFKHSNSYIVYEVRTENSAYSILLSRSQGKVVYRFIDLPYKKEWLVGKDGRVESDWIKVREKIGAKVDISAKIDTYELYRNIIFGNTHDRSHKFDKYALVESAKYQNIPRSIQNVFLNSKLDADFVKTTIIQSMTDTEDSISLSTYRHLVADFEREFDEIDCWYKKDANGEVAVRIKAQKVVDTYRLLVALDYELKQTWHRLNYAVAHTREQMPKTEDTIRSLQESLRRIKEKIDNGQQEFEKEHDLLTKKISVCDVRLGDIRQKRNHYDEIGIKDIIALVEQEPKYLQENTQKENMLRTLQEQYKDVTEKYRALYAALDIEWNSFVAAQNEERNNKKTSILKEQEKLQKARDERKKNIDAAYNEWLTASDERMKVLNEECNRTDKRLSELRYWHPLKAETDACRDDIRSLSEQVRELEGQLTITRNELKQIIAEGQMKCEQTEKDYARKAEVENGELKLLQEELAKTEELLSRWKGSLYEWLTQNKPGWEDTIGKVADEQNVLYAQGLAPEMAEGETMFGVRLNLNAIPVHHRTPDEYRHLQKEQQEAVSAKKKVLVDLEQEKEQKLDNIQKSYKWKLSDLRQQETTLSVQLQQIPQKKKDAETRLRQLEQKEQQQIADEHEKRTQAYNDARLNLERESENRAQQKAKREKEFRSADSEYNSAAKAWHKNFDEFCQKQETESSERRKDIGERKQMLERQERDELKGKGADTSAIELCRKDIERVQRLLDDISEKRHFVIEYRKDEKELFSRESEFKDEKRKLEARDAQMRQIYNDKRKRYENEQSEKSGKLNEQSNLLESMKEGLNQYGQLCGVENILPASFLEDEKKEQSSETCGELVVQMRGALNKKRQKADELKRATNSFNSHFGANNTFHFIVPQLDEEYLEFALNLKDFIENDKIEDYRERVSEHYNTILRSVSREVGLLMNHSAEIKGIINEVNRDFQERNFAGVIKSIELRAEESSDRMMQLLRSICDFTVENELNMGELNLFSGTDRDEVNKKVIEYLKRFMRQLQKEPSRTELSLSDTFRLQFRIQENDNNTGWVERINNVGSDGTDILVKAMVNIMLINVFKTKASRKNGDFIIHCMMDEIGKLHPSNVSGILQFANVRNIYLINSSPIGYNADIYKYNYLLTKDGKSQTHVTRLLTNNG